jgi:branched-subunit amino acid aminotransferase/4-amino-4-deoxychorismate lyase
MHQFVSFNHQIRPASETNLSALSSASLYGRNIFTTCAIYHSEPFLWEKHWRRLTENAERIGLDLSECSEETVRNSLANIIRENSVVEGRARLTFFDESPGRLWSFESEKKTSLLITTGDVKEISEIKLTVSPFRINLDSPLRNLKSGNYLEYLLALEEAHQRGFNEAIRLNQRGEIVSGCLSNIFWLKGQRIYTPGLKTGCLAGTTREFLLENFDIFEVEATFEVLNEAEMMFLSSAGIGIKEIESLGNRKFEPSEKFSQLRSEFLKLI